MTYDEVIVKASEQLGLSKSWVDKVYKAYWGAIKDMLQELPLKDNLTEEEFYKLKTSVNIPRIGKLAVTWKLYKEYKDRYLDWKSRNNIEEDLDDKVEEDSASIYQDTSDS